MIEDTCKLTTRGFVVLEEMLGRCLGTDDPMRPLIRRKLDIAEVLFAEDIPEDVVTLRSRITYRINGQNPHSRLLSHWTMGPSVGLFLSVSNPWGLALLGLSAGQTFRFVNPVGEEESVLLASVDYQPEADARRKIAAAAKASAAEPVRALRIVHNSECARSAESARPGRGLNDPGPSAA